MRLLLCSAALVLVGAQGTAQTSSNQGVIAGRVTRPGGEGISEVHLLLVGPLSGTAANAAASNPLMIEEIAQGAGVPQANATTGNDGRFSFPNLASGQYMIRAQREGHFSASPSPAGGLVTIATAPVTLKIGTATPEVQLTMIRGATISGRVRNSNGQPAANLNVAVYQIAYRDGRETLSVVNPKSTDDRGEYRIFWVAPGEYYLAARAQVPGSRTFYPSVAQARSATRLTVTEGAEITGMDIDMVATQTARITGHIVNSLSTANASPRAINFYLVPRDLDSLSDTAMPSFTNTSITPGEFEIRGVPQGAYDLVATIPDSTGRPYPGRVGVEVGSHDLEAVTLSIHHGVEVKARVFIDGRLSPAPELPQSAPASVSGTPFVFNNGGQVVAVSPPAPIPIPPASLNTRVPGSTEPVIRVQMRSKEIYPVPFDTAAANVTTDASGAYVFPNVPESVYSIVVSGIPANNYVADIREGGVSIYDSGLVVGDRPPGPIDVIVSSGAQSIRGTVHNAEGKPAASATVVAVPQPGRRQNAGLYKTYRTNFNGEFTLNGLPPGDYKLFAWESVPNTAYMNAEFMAKYESLGKAITVDAGANLDFDLTVIPAVIGR